MRLDGFLPNHLLGWFTPGGARDASRRCALEAAVEPERIESERRAFDGSLRQEDNPSGKLTLRRAPAVVRTADERLGRARVVAQSAIPDALEAAHQARRERGEPTTPRGRHHVPKDRASTQDGTRLHDLAAWYSFASRQYNGDPPLARNASMASYLVFGAAYWDVPENTPGLEIFGDPTPLRVGSDQIRIPAHPSDFRRRELLEQCLGRPPDGWLPAEMQSSKRTVLVVSETPFFLKLSGDHLASDLVVTESHRKRVEAKLADPRTSLKERLMLSVEPRRPRAHALQRHELEVATLRAARYPNDPLIVKEPLGLALQLPDGLEHTVLYRPFLIDAESSARLPPDSALLPLHALADYDFGRWRDPARSWSRRFLPACDREAKRRWLETQIAPRYAEFVLDSMFSRAEHFTLHAQNIDVLLGPGGEVRRFFVKDLNDVVADPLLALALGQDITDAWRLAGEWGFMGEYRSRTQKPDDEFGNDVFMWYRTYLTRLEYNFYSDDYAGGRPDKALFIKAAREFEGQMGAALLEGLEPRLKALEIPEAGAVAGAWDLAVARSERHDIALRFAALRESLIKSWIGAHFSEDPEQEPRLLAAKDELLMNYPASPSDLEPSFLGTGRRITPTFGTAAGHSVGITRRLDGSIATYYLRLTRGSDVTAPRPESLATSTP